MLSSPVSIAELDSIDATAAAASFSSLLLAVAAVVVSRLLVLLPLLPTVVEQAFESVLGFLQSLSVPVGSGSGEQARFLDAAPAKFGLN